jgi:hypothetical protein
MGKGFQMMLNIIASAKLAEKAADRNKKAKQKTGKIIP